jgi:O-antigen ligase
MAKTSLNMVRAAPIFGIGVGRFLQESPRYGGTGLMDVVGVRRDHENAHNNFLQVAAEEGILGLGALLFLLGGLAVGVIRAPIDAVGYATQTARLRLWIAAGLCGFLLTWLTSHPMLVRQAAFEFWLFAGVLAGLTPAPVWRRRLSALPIAGAVLILLSAPVRAQINFRNADLEYRGIGVSAWIHEGTLRYRLGGARFSLYMPADRPIVLLPIRREPDAPPEVRVRMYADGRLLNEIPLAGIEWERVPLRFATMHRRYVRIDFVVDAPNATGPISPVLVHVAKEISP